MESIFPLPQVFRTALDAGRNFCDEGVAPPPQRALHFQLPGEVLPTICRHANLRCWCYCTVYVPLMAAAGSTMCQLLRTGHVLLQWPAGWAHAITVVYPLPISDGADALAAAEAKLPGTRADLHQRLGAFAGLGEAVDLRQACCDSLTCT